MTVFPIAILFPVFVFVAIFLMIAGSCKRGVGKVFLIFFMLFAGTMLLYLVKSRPRVPPIPAVVFHSAQDEFATAATTRTVRAKPKAPEVVGPPQADVTTIEGNATAIEAVDESDDTALVPGEPAPPLSIKETVYHDGGSLVTTKSLSDLPDWVEESGEEQPRPGLRDFVLSSQRYATVEEARNELMPQLKSRIASELRTQHPQLGSDWHPAMQTAIEAGAVLRECEVAWPLTVGGFTEPVYRVHWQIDLDDEAMEQFYVQARPHIVEDRLQTLAIGIGGLTLLLGGSVLVLRRRESSKVS